MTFFMHTCTVFQSAYGKPEQTDQTWSSCWESGWVVQCTQQKIVDTLNSFNDEKMELKVFNHVKFISKQKDGEITL